MIPFQWSFLHFSVGFSCFAFCLNPCGDSGEVPASTDRDPGGLFKGQAGGEGSFLQFFPKDRWNLTLIHDTSPNEIFLEGPFFLLRFIHKFTLQKHGVFPHDVFHKFTNYLTSWGSPWKLLEEKISSDSNPYYKIKVSLRVGIWWNAWKKVQHVCLVFHFHLVWGENRELFQLSFKNIVPSRKLTYPTLGKGDSSTQNCLGNGYVSSC